MKILRSLDMLHPILRSNVKKIQKEVIDTHNIPVRLFETGRTNERHRNLMDKGREFSLVSPHLFRLNNNPPLYATAVSYVFFDDRWSWNMRDFTIKSWYTLFGNLVMDACPNIQWGGLMRKNMNLTLFVLKQRALRDNYEEFPCVLI